MWATQAARSLRLATQATPGAVCVGAGAAARAGALVALCHRAARLWRGDGGGRAAAGQRLGAGAARRAGHAGSEPGKGAGFSGEGAVLHLVADGDANEDAAFVSTLLAFEPRIDIAQLAARALLPDAQIASALGVLASSGQVGFDLAAGAYFHRPLPVQAGCWIRCIPGWPRRASWWPAAGCGAKARGSTRCNRRSSATGSRWAPSPRKTVAPAPGTPVSRHARAVQAHAGGAHVS